MSNKAIWRQFDQVFLEMDKFFEQIDCFVERAKKANSNVHMDSPDEHKVRFRATGLGERVRFAWQFFWMALSMVCRGHATVVFRRRKQIK